MGAIHGLAADPRPHSCVKLSGSEDAYRVRVGVFRIVYMVDDGLRIVTVTRVGHRQEVHKR